jgi:Luciferase-like monooxygenase
LYSIRFDMRAPALDGATTDLYATAIEMCAWAEQHGCLAAVLCEHHGSDDGYLPAPLILASAIAARTERLVLTLVVILPFCDPVRLAEEIAVLDIISKGRTSYVLGLGYRQEEFEHFGLDIAMRGKLSDHKLPLLRALLSGEEVSHDGRRIRVTPPPVTPGGARADVGRREPCRGASSRPIRPWPAGERERARYAGGVRDRMPRPRARAGPDASSRARDPGRHLRRRRRPPAWDELGDYLLHDARTYAEWNPDNESSAGISFARNVVELRESFPSHRILSVAEAIEIVTSGEMLNLSPLCGGVPPDVAWPYLERVGELVLPAATRAAAAPPRADGLSEAFNELIPSEGT